MHRSGCVFFWAGLVGVASAMGQTNDLEHWRVVGGSGTVWFETSHVTVRGLYTGGARATGGAIPANRAIGMTITPGKELDVVAGERSVHEFGGLIGLGGSLSVTGPRASYTLGPLVLEWQGTPGSRALLLTTTNAPERFGFVVQEPVVQFDRSAKRLVVSSDAIRASSSLARALGDERLARHSIGAILVRVAMEPEFVSREALTPMTNASVLASAIGPDVIVLALKFAGNFGQVNGVSAFSVSTESCNIGDQPAEWFRLSRRHPVISQNMYRLKDDRFEQIGMSWVKHGFMATMGNSCGLCQDPGGANGTLLGINCSDLYSATLNGEQANMGPRSQVNAHTGVFPFPFSASEVVNDAADRRIQVLNDDIDPLLNQGAQYFAEGHYVTADDAAAGNQNNNASHRPITFVWNPVDSEYQFTLDGTTHQQEPAIRAWGQADPSVVETDIQLTGGGLLILAAKVTAIPAMGEWQYEYALHNLNSDQSGQSFSIPLPPGATVSSTGFHDVDYHSGDPFVGTDWPVVVGTSSITWATQTWAQNVNANALRWGTLYNFRFTSNVPPVATTATLGLFKPPVGVVMADTVGPDPGIVDCNGNQIADDCDVNCGQAGGACDVPMCGLVPDCDGNGVPDDCQSDCNNNNVADVCDVDPLDPDGDGNVFPDCNGNLSPDGCEPDCDGDGIPSACDRLCVGGSNDGTACLVDVHCPNGACVQDEDTDGDGLLDCNDQCPTTNAGLPCVCPSLVLCCLPFGDPPPDGCFGPIPLEDCTLPSTPLCPNVDNCVNRNGCLLGDANDDGRIDLFDFADFQRCFSASPTAECMRIHDYDENLAVDLNDFSRHQESITGP